MELSSMDERTELLANQVLSDGATTGIDINIERNEADDENGGEQLGEIAAVEMITTKRKRGRPRKYNIGCEVRAPVSPQRSSTSSEFQCTPKRRRGRPRGSGRLQALASSGGFAWQTAGGSFTPHVVKVAAGEDIVSRISSFSQRGPRATCVLSATGAVSTVMLQQPGCILRFEGMFEILRLSGSFIGEKFRSRRKRGYLTVSLAKPDGRVFGGVVGSSLIAATPVQIIVGSFKQNLSSIIKKWLTPAENQDQDLQVIDASTGEEEDDDAPTTPS